MKKGLIKIIIILTCMVIMIVGLSKSHEDKIYLKDISGNRKELGDMSIVYNYNRDFYYSSSILLEYEPIANQSIESIYNMMYMGAGSSSIVNTALIEPIRKETIISKDGIKTIELTKEEAMNNYTSNDYIKYERKYSDRLGIVGYDEQFVFENGNCIGVAYITKDYEERNHEFIEGKIIDKKTDKVKEIKIPLGSEFKSSGEDDYIQIYSNFIHNNDIYAVIKNDFIEDDYSKYIMSIVKLDIDDKSYRHIKDIKDLKIKEQFTGLSFVHNGKLYIGIEEYGKYDGFLIYDIEDNTIIRTQNIKTYGDIYNAYGFSYTLIDYKVEDNMISMIIKGNESYIYKLTYSLPNFDLIKSEKYNFKANYATRMYNDEGNNKLIYVDDKLISMYHKPFETNRKDKSGKYYTVKGKRPVEIKVFDTNKNKIVYEGEITSSNRYVSNNLYIVKNH